METSERVHALDAVRAFALLLGVALHAAMSFVPGIGSVGWPIVDNSPSAGVGSLFFVIHTFRMTSFFVVAGFFAHMLYHRQGAKGFWLNRAKRVLAPLVVFWPLVLPAIVAAMYLAAVKSGAPLATPKPTAGTVLPFPLAHLWFLYVLLGLYALLLAMRSVLLRALPTQGQRLRSLADAVVARICTTPLASTVLALPVALALYAHPHWYAWVGIPTPDHSLLPNVPALVAFGVALSFGWLLRRQPQALNMMSRHALVYAVAAAILTSACLAMAGLTMSSAELSGWRRAAYALGYGAAGWCWTFAIIGAAQRFLSRPAPWRRYLADASYWIYLVHLPIVFGLQAAMQDWPLHSALKFPLVLGIAMLLLLLSYQGLVRSTWVGAWLNGRRYARQGAVGRHRES